MVESSSDMSSQRKKHSWLSPIGQRGGSSAVAAAVAAAQHRDISGSLAAARNGRQQRGR
jgi:hypothetical protein